MMPYDQWVMERLKVIKLTFKSNSFPLEQSQSTKSEEVKILKEEIERMKMKSDKLIDDLQSLQQECASLRCDNKEKTRMYQELFKK